MVRELEKLHDDEAPDETEIVRLKMLRQIVSMAMLAFITMTVGGFAMFPEAVGFITGIGVMSGSIGFTAGRHLYRQERRDDAGRMEEVIERLEAVLDDGHLDRTMRTARREALAAKNHAQQSLLRLDEEREARKEAQRVLVEHMRDCGLHG